MDANPATLSEILSADKKYIVPVFQRFYSWKESNWKTLWTDIKSLVNDSDQDYEHFIGPMIVNPRALPHDITRFFVIDGQQRLITLSILLCAVRDVASVYDLSTLVIPVEELLLFKTTRGETVFRLEPRFADRDPFRKVLEGNTSARDSEEMIVQAYQYFKREIELEVEQYKDDEFTYLNELFEAIKKRLKLVSITLEDKDDPTKIFESMNFKQEKLLNADLIRNYALMQLPIDRQDAFGNTQWEGFETLFVDGNSSRPNSDELEDFYYRYLITRTNYFAKGKVYPKFTAFAADAIVGENANEVLDSLGQLVASLKRYARYYRAIMHPELEPDNDLGVAFGRFHKLDVSTALPLIMEWYDRFDDDSRPDTINKESFLRMINALESFVIRRSILGERTRGYGSDFAKAKQADSLQELYRYFSQRGWPNDSAFSEALVYFPLYSKDSVRTRLILDELEMSFGHKEQVDVRNSTDITIEHILPQSENLSAGWKDMLGENAAEVHERFRDTLGNLTLTGYNRELGKKSFEDKKLVYARYGSGSHLELNTFVLQQQKWTEQEIRARAAQLSERLVNIWPRQTGADNS